MRVFRITYGKSDKTIVDVQAEHIGLAIGKALKNLQERHYTYKIEDCVSAELIANPIEENTKEANSQ